MLRSKPFGSVLGGLIHPAFLASAKRYALDVALHPQGHGIDVRVPAGLDLPAVLNIDNSLGTTPKAFTAIEVGVRAKAHFVFGCVTGKEKTRTQPNNYQIQLLVREGAHFSLSLFLSETEAVDIQIEARVDEGASFNLQVASFNDADAVKLHVTSSGRGQAKLFGFHAGGRGFDLKLRGDWVSGAFINAAGKTFEGGKIPDALCAGGDGSDTSRVGGDGALVQTFSKNELDSTSAVMQKVLSFFPMEYATEVLLRLEDEERGKED